MSIINSNTRPKMDCGLVGILALTLLLLIQFPTEAFSMSEAERTEKGLIEVHYAPDSLAPYRERRQFWAPVFGIRYEYIKPEGYISDFTDNNNTSFFYGDIFDSAAIPMFGFYGGIQFNFSGFSIAPTVGVSSGSIEGSGLGGAATLNVTMKKAGVSIALDAIMQEPYVVPIVHVEMNSADYTETFMAGTDKVSSSETVQPFLSFTAGVLIQLNWMDPDGAFTSLKESGLNNSFVHIYASQTSKPTEGNSFASAMSLGGGLRMEF